MDPASLLGLLVALLAASSVAPAGDGQERAYERLRAPLFGLAVERERGGEQHRLVRVVSGSGVSEELVVLAAGTLETCEQRLVAVLRERYGDGRLNLPFATMGGGQFWADELIQCGWRIQENVYTGHFRLLDARDTRRAWGSFEACRVALEEARIAQGLEPTSPRLVLLVHGLFRTKGSLDKLRRALTAAGYDVESVNYPSTRRSIGEHAAQLERVLGHVEGYASVSFVTHSLGGIVVRELLGRKGAWRERLPVHRLVMIAPPSRGSVVADVLKDWLAFELAAGASGQELTPARVARVPEPDCEFGIVAGGNGTPRGRNPLLGGDNDGTVLVESARLDSAADFLLVDALHSFLMNDARVIAATVRFLDAGRFEP